MYIFTKLNKVYLSTQKVTATMSLKKFGFSNNARQNKEDLNTKVKSESDQNTYFL